MRYFDKIHFFLGIVLPVSAKYTMECCVSQLVELGFYQFYYTLSACHSDTDSVGMKETATHFLCMDHTK